MNSPDIKIDLETRKFALHFLVSYLQHTIIKLCLETLNCQLIVIILLMLICRISS